MKFLKLLSLLVLTFCSVTAFGQGVRITDSDGKQTVLRYADMVHVYADASSNAAILYGRKYQRFSDTTDYTAFLQTAGNLLLSFTDVTNDRALAIPVSSISQITKNVDNTARIFQTLPGTTSTIVYDTEETFTAINTLFAAASYSIDQLTGGAEYVDTSFRAAPLVVDSAETITLQNLAQLRYEDQLPSDLGSMWNKTDSLILGQAGDILQITIHAVVNANTADATWMEVVLDVDGTNYAGDVVTLPKGQNVDQDYSWTTTVLVDAAWETNGAKVKVTAGDALDVTGDISYTIVRLKKSGT